MRVRAAKGEKNSDLGPVENIVKKLSTLLAFSTILAYGARAADLPEAPAVYDWTGFYPGGNIGYAFCGDDKVGITEKGLTALQLSSVNPPI